VKRGKKERETIHSKQLMNTQQYIHHIECISSWEKEVEKKKEEDRR